MRIRWAHLILAGAMLAAGCSAGIPSQPSALSREEVIFTGEVLRIDREARRLVLRGPAGEPEVVAVPPGIGGLEEVRPGDRVTVRHTEAVLTRATRPASGAPSMRMRASMGLAPGETPGTAAVQEVSLRARVERVDPARNTLTFSTPGGEVQTVRARDSEVQSLLPRLQPGELLDLTYTEAVALSIVPETRILPRPGS